MFQRRPPLPSRLLFTGIARVEKAHPEKPIAIQTNVRRR